MIEGIWNNKYVRRLGILDHCRELLIIDDEIRRIKNAGGPNRQQKIEYMQDKFNNELVDLYLIALKDIDEYDYLINQRHKKFAEKAKELSLKEGKDD